MVKKIILKLRDGRTYTKTSVGNRGNGTWWQRNSNHTYYPRKENVEEVVEYLGTFDRTFSYTEVIESKNLSMSRTTTYKVLVSLEEDGKIEKLGRGKYQLVKEDGTVEEQPITETVSQEGEE